MNTMFIQQVFLRLVGLQLLCKALLELWCDISQHTLPPTTLLPHLTSPPPEMLHRCVLAGRWSEGWAIGLGGVDARLAYSSNGVKFLARKR